ncbi:MAG: TerB family tellurite resistance protein [Melioribacteraceae bacterium]
MLKYFKDLFLKEESANVDSENRNHLLQIASCALFLELANSDDEFTTDEKSNIIELMEKQFNMSPSSVENLIEQAEEKIVNSVSIYEFTEIVNEQLNNDEKYEIIKNLWRLAYVDDKLDKYEDYFIKKISNNLNMSNQDRISAKLEVKDEMKL